MNYIPNKRNCIIGKENIIIRSMLIGFNLMRLDFIIMLSMKILFAMIPLVGIKINVILYNKIYSLIKSRTEDIPTIVIGLLIAYIFFTITVKLQVIIYERYILQFGSLLKFEKKIKILIHEKCAKLVLTEYNNSNLYKYTYEAQVASINIYRIIEIILSFVAVIAGIIGIVGYFFNINKIYLLLVILATFPVLAEKIIEMIENEKNRSEITKYLRKEKAYKDAILKPKFYQENKIYNNFHFLFSKWEKCQKEYNTIEKKINKKYIWVEIFSCILSYSGNLIAFVVTVYCLYKTKDLGQFTAVMVAFATINEFVREISELTGYLTMFQSMVKPFFVLYDINIDDDKYKKWCELEAPIVTKDIEFRYMESEAKALKNINLSIKKGEKIALVGINGAGKTTLSKLLIGLYNPTYGEIYANGINIKEIDDNIKFKNTSTVLQDYCKYPLSVLKNITISNSLQNENRNIVENCMQMSGLKSLDIDLELGKEIGLADLSEGQWQRLAIARSIYKSSKIMLFDEPTSAIDPIKEAELYQLFNDISRDKTSIVVTHRLGSIKYVDKIYVLNQGEIIESGTHEELLLLDGLYKQMWKVQQSQYI